MDTPAEHVTETTAQKKAPRHGSRALRVLKIVGCSILGLAVFIVLSLSLVTWYLSSGKLTEILNHRASDYFYADFHARKCNFTLWSTFPHFCLQIDSLTVVSRTLNPSRLSAAERAALPAGADSLASMDHMRGSLNVIDLIAGKFELHDVRTSGLKLNMVTVNDSVNNFAIIPPIPESKYKIPYISANRIMMSNLKGFSFYSVPNKFKIRAAMRDASLTRVNPHKDIYKLKLNGSLAADFDSLKICRNVPFDFFGDLNFRFKPFALTMTDMRVSLANTTSNVSMSVDFGDNSGINSFRTEVSPFELMKLMEYLPAEFIPGLKGVHTDLKARISLRLTKPFRFSSDDLPSFIVDLSVPKSQITYTLEGGETYTVDDIVVHAALNFNGDDWRSSTCTIDRLRAQGEGLSLLLNGNIERVLSDPRLRANLELSVDIPRLGAAVPSLNPLNLKGVASVISSVDFPLSIFENRNFRDMPFDGKASVKQFAVTLPGGTTLHADNTDVRFSNRASVPLSAQAAISGIDAVLSDGSEISLPSITLNASAPTMKSCTADIVTPGLKFTSKKAKMSLFTEDFRASANFSCTSANIDGDADGVHFTIGSAAKPVRINANHLSVSADNILHSPVVTATASAATVSLPAEKRISGEKVSVSSGNFRHFTVSAGHAGYSLPDPAKASGRMALDIRGLSGSFDLNGKLFGGASARVHSGTFITAAYPAPIGFSALDASCRGIDSIALRNIYVRSGVTAFSLNGTYARSMRNDKPFYRCLANLQIDTLHFNDMARVYEKGSLYTSDEDKNDTVMPEHPFLIPDNMDLEINATADATVYTNLWLTNLGAHAYMRNNTLALDTVYLSADFGHAGASMLYRTPDLQNISLYAAASVSDFNLSKFFRSYPNVLEMMPEMGNLHGIFLANASLTTGIFPNMDMNTESLVASINASATDMYLHQNPFIHRLAHMALIYKKGDIHIPAIHAQARVFDHLLEVYPFDIYIDKYHLRALGRNDFTGNLYYHVQVLHNPLLPVKFGIDIEGMYHHPRMRLSTVRFSVPKSERIDHIDILDKINLIDKARFYGWMLIHHAAKAKPMYSNPFAGDDSGDPDTSPAK